MAQSPEKWAVLAGVDFYRGPPEGRLSGCVNDVEYSAALLTQYFSPIHVSKFVAEDTGDPNQSVPVEIQAIWPTYDNIVNELKRIVQIASPGDHVYFHYAGHGTLKSTKRMQYTLGSSVDAALVLFDDASFWGVRYLRGIELSVLFSEMVVKGLALTVVLDCCHSGAVTRGEDQKFRGLDWNDEVDAEHPTTDTESITMPSLDQDAFRSGEVTESWLLAPNGYTVLTACGPDELANECWTKYGRSHGLLTFHFLEALTKSLKAGLECDLREIYRIIRARMQYHHNNQNPTLIGGSQVSFMGQMTLNDIAPEVCEVSNVRSDGTISLNIGYAHGVCVGDQYKVLPSRQAAGAASIPQGEVYVKITAVHATQSDAIRDGNTPLTQVKKGWQSILSKTCRPRAHVQLFANASRDWTDEVDSSQCLQLTTRSALVPSLPLFSVELTPDQNHYIVTSNIPSRTLNMAPIPTSDKTASAKVISAIEHMAKFASIQQLENQITKSILKPSTFTIEITDPTSPGSPPGNTLQVTDGTQIQVTFNNRMSTTLLLVVLILDSRGGISKLYPSNTDYRAAPPKDRLKHFKVTMTVPDALKAKGHSQCDDTLLFIVTTRPTSFTTLILPKLSETIDNVTRDSGDSVLEMLDELDGEILTDQEWRDGGDDGGRRWTCQKFVVTTIVKP